jgi:hypothetical protein
VDPFHLNKGGFVGQMNSLKKRNGMASFLKRPEKEN